MNRDIAEKWIADLRAGPPQTMGKLFSGDGFCCLGRLCVVAGLGLSQIKCLTLPPEETISRVGMISRDGRYPGGFLVEDNDSGKTFAEIADIIESHIDEL